MIHNSLKFVLKWKWTKPKRNVVVALFVPYRISISNRLVAFLVLNILGSLHEQRFVSLYFFEYFQTCKKL